MKENKLTRRRLLRGAAGAVSRLQVAHFAARRPAQVDVTGTRQLTVEEIVARYQAQQRRQDAIVKTTIADGTTTLLFEVPDFSAPITITVR